MQNINLNTHATPSEAHMLDDSILKKLLNVRPVQNCMIYTVSRGKPGFHPSMSTVAVINVPSVNEDLHRTWHIDAS